MWTALLQRPLTDIVALSFLWVEGLKVYALELLKRYVKHFINPVDKNLVVLDSIQNI